MEKQKFRNHFSITIENLVGFIIAIAIIAILLFEDIIIELIEGKNIKLILIGLGIFLVLLVIAFIWQYWVWRKTWIILDEGSISIERNTLMFSKDTIGIKNISNINIEQNIFEMILGTSKVKINTNSLSTADLTDVKIVLKKNQAEELKKKLLQQMKTNKGKKNNQDGQEIDRKDENEKTGVVATTKDVISHCLVSINIIAQLILATFYTLVLLGLVVTIGSEILGEKKLDQYLDSVMTPVIAIIVFAAMMCVIIATKCLNTYFKFHNFSTKRKQDKIYIKYGLFKQLDYTIPVKTISAVIVRQSMLARILKKYAVEIVNVGMGDENEESTYLCLYGSKNKINDTIKNILPEYLDAINSQIKKQPRKVWYIKTIGIIIELLIFGFAGIVIGWVEETIAVPVIGVCIIMALCVIRHILNYNTTGMSISGKNVGICRGTYAKEYIIIKIENIQYFSIETNPISNKLGIVKGSINVLAMIEKNVQVLPYFDQEQAEEIKKIILKK